jgi:hypothetical protein
VRPTLRPEAFRLKARMTALHDAAEVPVPTGQLRRTRVWFERFPGQPKTSGDHMRAKSTRQLTGMALAAVLAVAFGVAIGAQAADPLIGTWKLDVAKSSYKPGPVPKSAMVVVSGAATEITVAVDAVMADGTPMKWGYTSAGDGKDVPVTGNPNYDMANVTQTGPMDRTIVYKKDGKVTATTKTSVAKDGTTLTVTTTGTNAKGQAMNNVSVYTKQ